MRSEIVNVNGKNRVILFFLELLIIYRILSTYVPLVNVRLQTGINIAVLGLIYVLFIYFIGLNGILKIVEKIFPLIILFSVNEFIRNSFNIAAVLRFLVWPISIFVIYKNNSVNTARRLLLVFIVSIIATMITTYIGNIEFPNVSRSMAHFHADGLVEMSRFYRALNIGGFDFVYTLPFLPPFAIFCFKKYDGKLKILIKALSVAFVGVLVLTVYQVHYTTALLTTILSVTLLFTPKIHNTNRFFLYYLGLAILLIVFSTLISSLFDMLAKTTESGVYEERFYRLSKMFSEEELEVGDGAERVLLYKQSIESFFAHPLGGGKPGGHSLILDMMGRLGIFGLIILIWGMSNLYKHFVIKYRKKLIFQYCFYLFVLQIIIGLLNPFLYLEFFLFLIPLFTFALPKSIR